MFAAAAAMPGAARATEAMMGRYTPGVFAAPAAGVVPPEPGVYWLNSSMYYSGSAKKTLRAPVAGSIVTGIEGEIAATTFTALYVPNLHLGANLTLGFAASLPFEHMKAEANLGPLGSRDAGGGIGDIGFTPMLGWRSGHHFVSGSVRIFAPTGPYRKGALANIGMNYWTFSPTVAYTYLDAEEGLDISGTLGLDLNTWNNTTNYRSGAMAHLDVSAIKNVAGQFGIGLFGSVLYQVADDQGTLADRLDGFRGRSFAIGPIARYSTKIGGASVSMSANWAPEFGVKNRLEGNAFYLNLTAKF